MTERAPRLLVARRVERDGNVYAGPFMPAARRAPDDGAGAPAVRHPIVQRDHRRPARPAVPRVRHQALPRAVRRVDLHDRALPARAVEQARLLIEGRQDELVDEPAARDGRGRRRRALRARGAPARRDPHDRDAARSAQQDGDAVAAAIATRSASRSARAGAVVQVFQMRRGRVVDRIELVTDRRDAAERRGGSGDDPAEVLDGRRSSSSTPSAPPPPEVHLPVELGDDERDALEAGWPSAPARRVRLVVPQRGDEARAARAGVAQRGDGLPDALRRRRRRRRSTRSTRCAPCSTLPALPRRIECFDISTLQGRETSRRWSCASNGRMRRGGSTASSKIKSRQAGRRPRRLRVDARGRAAALSARARAGRAVSGSDR